MNRKIIRHPTETILTALREARGLASIAAPKLDVSLRTLRRWMKEDNLFAITKAIMDEHGIRRRGRQKAPPKPRVEKVRATKPPKPTRAPKPPMAPKTKNLVNTFRQGPKLGPKPKHDIGEHAPLTSRSVSNVELRRSGGYTVLEGDA